MSKRSGLKYAQAHMSENLARLEVVRASILKLAGLQVELRSQVSEKIIQVGGAPEVFKSLDMEEAAQRQTAGFLTGGHALCSGALLERLCAFIERPQLCEEIQQAAQGMPSKNMGLTPYAPEAINLIFDIEICRLQVAPELTQEEFAGVFRPHNETVFRSALFNNEAVSKLSNDVIAALRAQMENKPQFSARLEEVRTAKKGFFTSKAEEMRSLMKQVAERFPELRNDKNNTDEVNREKLGDLIEVHRGTIGNALCGAVGVATAEKIIKGLQKLLKEGLPQKTDKAGAPKPPVVQLSTHAFDIEEFQPPAEPESEVRSEPSQVADQGSTEDVRMPIAIEQFMGETSPLGVEYVLTPECFRELSGPFFQESISFTKRVLMLARGLLNVHAQNKDDKERKGIREELGSDVEELKSAIEVFSFAYPNRLVPLYQAQRQTWGNRARGQRGSTTKKTRRS